MSDFFQKIKSLFVVSKDQPTVSNQDMLFKNIKSLFIVSNDDQEAGTNNSSSESADLSASEHSEEEVQEIIEELGSLDDFDERLAAALEGEIIDEHGVVDSNIVEQLLMKVGEFNLDGFDYFEYKQSLKAMDRMTMDEATKYRSAFATASTMGITLQKLLDSANYYLDVLDQQDEQFKKEANEKKQRQVEQKESETAKLEKEIQQHEEQIKRLKEKITRKQTRVEELEREVKIDRVKLDKERNTFLASFHFLRSQFADDVAKMKKYLK